MRQATKADLELVNNPDAWPCWPRLPMKKYSDNQTGDFPEFGFIVEGGGSTVYLGSVFGVIDMGQVKRKHYDSFNEMLDDGWVVD